METLLNVTDRPLPDFAEKVVIFYLANNHPQYAVSLESPTFQKHDGRLFVVGPYVSEQNWADGLLTSIAWDQVQYFIVFGSKAEYDERRGIVRKKRWRRLFAPA